jgi:hypothetical protein
MRLTLLQILHLIIARPGCPCDGVTMLLRLDDTLDVEHISQSFWDHVKFKEPLNKPVAGSVEM